MFNLWLLPVFVATAAYQAIATHRKKRQAPPGQLINVESHSLHLSHLTSNNQSVSARPTVVDDHSLGGVEGYLLIILLHKRQCLPSS